MFFLNSQFVILKMENAYQASKLEELTYVAFDVETTGLSPVAHRLVELSGVKFDYHQKKVETFSHLINPEVAIPPEVVGIHGIDDKMVEDKPKASFVIPEFLNWIGEDTVLIAHNAPFDLEFMRVNIARLGLNCPTNYVLDTLVISRELMPDAPRHQLKTVVELLGLPTGGYHRALADSVHVKDIFLKLMGDKSLGEFANLSTMGAVSTFNFDRFLDDVVAGLPDKDRKNMDRLKHAIDGKAVVEMTYQGAVTTRRRVKPISLVHSRGQIYLNAFCVRVNAERTFRLDRISKLKEPLV